MAKSLDRSKTYQVLRVGENTKHTVQGEYYILSHEVQYGWVCRAEEGGRVLYNGNPPCFQNPKYWTIEFCYEDEQDEEIPYVNTNPKEITMSFDKVKTEALEIKENVTLVNGVAESKFSDEALEALTIAEAQKLQAYKDTVTGVVGKYFDKKVKKMQANVQTLQDLLDARLSD